MKGHFVDGLLLSNPERDGRGRNTSHAWPPRGAPDPWLIPLLGGFPKGVTSPPSPEGRPLCEEGTQPRAQVPSYVPEHATDRFPAPGPPPELTVHCKSEKDPLQISLASERLLQVQASLWVGNSFIPTVEMKKPEYREAKWPAQGGPAGLPPEPRLFPTLCAVHDQPSRGEGPRGAVPVGGGPRPEALPAVLWQEHPSSQMEPRGCPPKLLQKGLLLGIPELPPPGSSSASLA